IPRRVCLETDPTIQKEAILPGAAVRGAVAIPAAGLAVKGWTVGHDRHVVHSWSPFQATKTVALTVPQRIGIAPAQACNSLVEFLAITPIPLFQLTHLTGIPGGHTFPNRGTDAAGVGGEDTGVAEKWQEDPGKSTGPL